MSLPTAAHVYHPLEDYCYERLRLTERPLWKAGRLSCASVSSTPPRRLWLLPQQMANSQLQCFSQTLSELFLFRLLNPMQTFPTSQYKAIPILSPMRTLFHRQHSLWPRAWLVRWCWLAIGVDPHSHGNLTSSWGNQNQKNQSMNFPRTQKQKLP